MKDQEDEDAMSIDCAEKQTQLDTINTDVSMLEQQVPVYWETITNIYVHAYPYFHTA